MRRRACDEQARSERSVQTACLGRGVYRGASRGAGNILKAILPAGCLLLVIGCQPAHHGAGSGNVPPVATEPASAMPAAYTLTGSVRQPGVHVMASNDTIHSVLASQIIPGSRQRLTITLIRRGPEGMVRQLIDVDAKGHPLDERDNIALRNGDELIVSPEAREP